MRLHVKATDERPGTKGGSESFEKQEDSSPREVAPYKCQWCPRLATHKDWREIDGTTTSTLECDVCANLDTDYLLKRDAKRKSKTRK